MQGGFDGLVRADRRRRIGRAVALAASLAVATVFAGAPAEAAGPVPLKVGTMRSSSQTPDYYAQKHGIFAKNGLDVTLTEFTNGSNAIAAGQSGAIDIMVAIPSIAMSARQNGFDLVALFQTETAHKTAPDTGSLQVLATSKIKSLKDLAGKKIGVASLFSQNTVSVRVVLEKAGVDVKSVQFIEMPFPAMVNALKAGFVDAVSLIDPFTTQVETSGVGRVLAWTYVDSVPEQPTSVWWAKSSFVDKNPDAVRRFNLSIKQAIDALNADPEKARGVLSAFTGLAPTLVDKMRMPSWNYHVDEKVWQAVIDMMKDSGVLKRPLPVDAYFAPEMKKYIVKD